MSRPNLELIAALRATASRLEPHTVHDYHHSFRVTRFNGVPRVRVVWGSIPSG